MSKTAAKMQIENVLQPGKTYSADPAKYEAMKRAVLAVLPKTSPGLTVADVQDRCGGTSAARFVPRRGEIRLVDEGRSARPGSEEHHPA